MNNLLRALVDLRDRQIQKARIQFGNRLAALDKADSSAGSVQRQIVELWLMRFHELEKQLDQDIASVVRDEPMYEHIIALRGIGPILAAKMIAMIDIERAPTVSALWRYAGYAVIDGEREKPVKGEKLHYNKRLKIALRLVAESFIKSNSSYRAIYDAAKPHYAEAHPDWTPLHVHNAAMRKMVKVFLSHLWQCWRETENLPTRQLYVLEQLGHTHEYLPEDFGWCNQSE